MLICNNCNTVNNDHAVKCAHCQMAGNFRQQMGDSKSDDTPTPEYKLICRNCGSHDPGQDSKCAHCRFPISRPKKLVVDSETAQKLQVHTSAIQSQPKQH
jgi:ribosomal protein L40E